MAGPLLVVRHAVAVASHVWSGDDALRPLIPEGEAQAVVLSEWLARQPFAVERLLSSPTRRCTATLDPLSVRTGRPIERCDELLHGRDAEAGALARRLLAADGGLLCTHGEVIPGLLAELAAPLEGPPPEETEKGALWLFRTDGTRTAVPTGGVERVEGRYLGPGELAQGAKG